MRRTFRWIAILILISCSAPARPSMGQSSAKAADALSKLTLQQARERVHELEQKINQMVAALPPLGPKDAFESTASYNQRKLNYENPKEVQALNTEIAKLKSGLYDSGITSAPVFSSYDADARTLIILLSGKSRSFTVPNGDAKQMHDNWTRLSLAAGYSEAGTGQDNTRMVLVWNENIYRENSGITGVMKIGGGGASPPACPLPHVEPDYTDAAKKAHIQGTVSLDVIVAPDGSMDVVKVASALGYGLDEEARKFVTNNFKCKPGMFNGQPVPTQARIDVNFHLY